MLETDPSHIEIILIIGVAVYLLKEIVIPLIRKNPVIEILNKQTEILEGVQKCLSTIENESGDLHEWHKPDHNGQQGWKNQGTLNAIKESISKQYSHFHNQLVEMETRLVNTIKGK